MSGFSDGEDVDDAEYLSDERLTGGSTSAEDDIDDDDDDDDEATSPAQPPSQNFFAPPFYGRPPTPLPPSPSFTSLLRPSRPTTPDASDDEDNNSHHNNGNNGNNNGSGGGGGGNFGNGNGNNSGSGGGGGGGSSRSPAPVPTYEYYGFVLYLFSSLTFLMYLLWAYLPSPFLHALGIYYYPNRWWALAIPAFLVMTVGYIYVALAAYNLEILTVPLNSVETIVDGAGRLAVIDGKGRLRAMAGKREREREREGGRGRERKIGRDGTVRWREVWNEGTDAVLDIPLAGVCEVLYGEGRDDLDSEEDGRG